LKEKKLAKNATKDDVLKLFADAIADEFGLEDSNA
jgi:hypothetical protein